MTKADNIKFLKKHGLKLWIIMAVVVLSGMIAFAAYTNEQNKAKKVIATLANAQMRFSSNYLEEGTTKVKTVVKTASDLTVPVTVRNYSRVNPTLWYQSDLTYSIRFELTDTTGSTDSTVINSLIGQDSVTVTLGSDTITLNAGTHSGSFNNKVLAYNVSAASIHTYNVTFPSNTTKICVKITATPVPADLTTLSAIISITDSAQVQSTGWTGSINDSQSKSPNAYDAYNYSLVGSGDSSNAKFRWNPAKIEVNRQYFLDHFNVDVSTATEVSGWKEVTITLKSVDGRYDFQLYKVYNAENPVSFDNWGQLEACIRFDDGID